MSTLPPSGIVAALSSAYRIERELGHGGMATVYLAHDLKHDRQVAVKVLRPEIASAVGADRFLREIAIAARLEHPHVLTLIDSGRAAGASGDGDILYYVMPFVDGASLRDRIAAEGALPVSATVRILREIVDAVAFAHRRGVVHRDIKPDNIMLSEQHARVLDFGIAKAMSSAATQTQLTGTGMSIGTPAYMAPEQALGDGAVDHRSDIYALGVLAHEMLAGTPPFTGSAQMMLAAHVTAQPPALTDLRPDVPPAVAAIVARCLEKDPAARFQSADDLLHALDALASAPQIPAIASAPSARWRQRMLVGAAAVVLIGAAAAFAKRQADRRWVRDVAVPAVLALADSGRADSAYVLARMAEARHPGDSLLAKTWPTVGYRRVIHSEPQGARVYRAFFHDTTHWELLGVTPTDSLYLPRAMSRYRVERDGHVPRHLLAGGLVAGAHAEIAVSGAALPDVILLEPADSPDADMLRVRGPRVGGGQLPDAARLADFRIGRHEVTNREFRAFIEAGGYRDRSLWTEPVVRDGRILPWEEAMALFVDGTGQPGPATWEGGAPPGGQLDLPVGGISWYEAMAYARSVGRTLPTVWHWQEAAGVTALTYLAAGSNFASSGPVRGNTFAAMSPSGAFDMAGNVREWCLNEDAQGNRYLLGGGWSDLVFRFNDRVARSALDRSAINGVRVAAYPTSDPLLSAAVQPIDNTFRDYAREVPMADAAFAALRAIYDYDPAPLDARVESRDTTPGDWITERVSFAAPYAGERVHALLFIPKRHAPPYQSVVYFPSGEALLLQSHRPEDEENLGFLMRSGRAVLLPIFQGTFDRKDAGVPTPQTSASIAYRDLVVSWGKDLRRSVDYLVARPDLLDTTQIGFLGSSLGGRMGGLMLAIESRFKAGVLHVAGMGHGNVRPEVDPFHFLPRVRVPVLMLNGRYDEAFPLESSQRPLFQLLGSPAAAKRSVLYDDGHNLPRAPMITESLAWFDRWLGPVRP